MIKKGMFLFTLLLLAIVAAGCSSADNGDAKTPAIGGPSKETLASLSQDAQQVAQTLTLPDFIADSPAVVRETYALAYANQDVIQYMPCFCGCGSEAGHQSNKDCFIDGIQSNGTVVWDRMSAT